MLRSLLDARVSFPRHRTVSEQTWTTAFAHLTTLICSKVDDIQGVKCHSTVETFRISTDCSKINRRLELSDIRVPVRNQIFIVTWLKMNWWFHLCWHKHHPRSVQWVFWSSIGSLSKRFNFFREILEFVVVQPYPCKWFSTPRTSFPVLPWRWHTPLCTSFLEPRNGLSSLCHTWEFVAGPWTLSRAGFPVLPETAFRPNSWFSRPSWAPESNEEVCLRAQEFPWHQTCRPRFRLRRFFFDFHFLSALRHRALLSVRKKMAARKHREIRDVEKTKKMVPLVTREFPFGKNVRKLGFGVNIFGLDLGVQVDSVKQPI